MTSPKENSSMPGWCVEDGEVIVQTQVILELASECLDLVIRLLFKLLNTYLFFLSNMNIILLNQRNGQFSYEGKCIVC